MTLKSFINTIKNESKLKKLKKNFFNKINDLNKANKVLISEEYNKNLSIYIFIDYHSIYNSIIRYSSVLVYKLFNILEGRTPNEY